MKIEREIYKKKCNRKGVVDEGEFKLQQSEYVFITVQAGIIIFFVNVLFLALALFGEMSSLCDGNMM